MNNYNVYKHTFPDGKIYIGVSTNPLKRWSNGHGYYFNVELDKAIKEVGWENIKHEILFDRLSKEEAEQKEIELNKIFSSIMEAQRQLNIGNSHISRCCLGKEKTAGGYHWKYFKKMNKEDKKIFDEHIKKIKEIIKEENELKLKLETLQNKKLEHINFLLKEN